MTALRIGIVGAGGMGRTHGLAYRKDSRCELAAFCDTNRELVDLLCAGGYWPAVDYGDELVSFSGQAPVEKAYYDVEALAADPDIDAVSICTPNKFHAPVAMLMMRSGKHVLVEKPMAANAAECEAMIALAREKGVILQVGHMWRFHPSVEMIRRVVSEGLIGEIVKVKGYGIHVNWGPDGWFVNRDLAIGGALIDMGVHAIDTISYVLDDPEPKQVYAKVETRYADYEVDDSGIIMVTYSNGATAIIESGWRNPYSDGEEASCQFFGTKGYARIFPTEVRTNMGGKWGRFTPDREPGDPDEQAEVIKTYFREVSAFCEAIAEGKPSMVPGEVGLRAMKIIDAAYASTKEGRAIDL